MLLRGNIDRTAGRIPAATAGAVALCIAAGALRVWQARESLWLDELHTAWTSGSSLAEVAGRAAIGNQPPLFFWLEWLLIRCFGSGELVLRLPSIVAGSLLPLAVILLAERWGQRGAGLLTAALIVIDPGLIFTATEARPYALVQLLAVVHVGLSGEMIVAPRRSLRRAWVALAAVLFYLHYTAALLVSAEIVFILLARWLSPGQPSYRGPAIALDLAILGALCLPAAGNLQAILQRRANWESFIPQWSLRQIFHWWPFALGSLYLIAAAVTQRFMWSPTRDDEPAGRRPEVLWFLALCWLLVPAMIAWALTATDTARLLYPRYLAASAPAALLVGGLCLELAPSRRSKWLVGTLLLGAAVCTGRIIEQVRDDGRIIGDRREDWRSAVRWLNEQLPDRPGPILVYSGLIEAAGLRQPHEELLEDYCLLPVTSLYPVAAQRTDIVPLPLHEPGRLTANQRLQVSSRGGAWLITRTNDQVAARIAEQIIAELGSGENVQHWQVPKSRSFGQVQVLWISR